MRNRYGKWSGFFLNHRQIWLSWATSWCFWVLTTAISVAGIAGVLALELASDQQVARVLGKQQKAVRIPAETYLPVYLNSKRASASQHTMAHLALIHAAELGNTTEVHTLLDGGASANVQDFHGWTPLMMAARGRFPVIVNLLLNHGAHVNGVNKRGDTALMLAANNGHLDIVETLLAHGAQINQKNTQGWTALTYAAWKGNAAVAQLLLTNGASVSLRDKLGWTTLQYVMWQRKNLLHSEQRGLPMMNGRVVQEDVNSISTRQRLENYDQIVRMLMLAETVSLQLRSYLLSSSISQLLLLGRTCSF